MATPHHPGLLNEMTQDVIDAACLLKSGTVTDTVCVLGLTAFEAQAAQGGLSQADPSRSSPCSFALSFANVGSTEETCVRGHAICRVVEDRRLMRATRGQGAKQIACVLVDRLCVSLRPEFCLVCCRLGSKRWCCKVIPAYMSLSHSP